MIKKYLLITSLLFSSLASIAQDLTINATATESCYSSGPVTLRVSHGPVKETTSYLVNSISPDLNFSLNSPTATNVLSDDNWTQIFDLKKATQSEPFNFSFYGNSYSKCLLNTNGVITFSIAGQIPGGVYTPMLGAGYTLNNAIPYNPGTSNGPYVNAIHGVFQDTNPSVGSSNINLDIHGTYPNRAFVFSMSNVSNYSCTPVVHTSQIVLYEGTNIIEVYVRNRSNDCSWQGGRAVLGIQNNNATQGLCPPNRNTGTWEVLSTAPEAWRFTPNGNVIVPTFVWKDSSGNVVGTGENVVVNPVTSETYTVTATYSNNGVDHVVTDTVVANVSTTLNQVQNGNDLLQCVSNGDPSAVFDLTVNAPVILNGLDPSQFYLAYHTSLADANDGSNEITPANATNYSVNVNQPTTIFVKVEDYFSAFECYTVKQFNIFAGNVPSEPTGDSNQTFVAGETLADLEVTGQNIQWYGSSTGNDLLPNETPLVDGVTYFASQTNSAGCQSRRTTPSRLAVTVQQVLSNDEWDTNAFKVYPNPVKNVLHFSYSSNITTVEIFNMLGQKLFSENLNATEGFVDMSHLTTGSYVVRVSADGLTKSIKIIKQ